EQVVYDEQEGMRFEVSLKMIQKGGTMQAQDSLLSVQAADEVTFYLAEATSFNGFDKSPGLEGLDPSIRVKERLTMASNKGYQQLWKEHIADYQKLFDRVSFHLDGLDHSDTPTNVRLKQFATNSADLGLQTLYYQF